MTLSKRVGSLLGGDGIVVSDLELQVDDEIFCTFGEHTVDGLYINENQALCVSPRAKQEGTVKLKIEAQRVGSDGQKFNISGGSAYQYSE